MRPPHAALPLARKHHERVPTLPPARPCCCFRTPLQRLASVESSRRSSRPSVQALLASSGSLPVPKPATQLPQPCEQFARLRKRSSGSALVDCCDRGVCERAVSILSNSLGDLPVHRLCGGEYCPLQCAWIVRARRVRRSAAPQPVAETWHGRRMRPTTPQHAALRLLAESLFPPSHAMHHEILNSNGSIVVCARTRCNKAGATK